MPFVNKAGCECLNESDDCGFDNCLIKDSSYLESDCDEQVWAVDSNNLSPPWHEMLSFLFGQLSNHYPQPLLVTFAMPVRLSVPM